jgi:hypothetical protein
VVFAALNSDYEEFARIFRFKLPQLRKYVNAVYSPVGPEIQEHYLPSQVSKPELLSASMNPVEIVGKLGRSHRRCGGKLAWHPLKSSLFGRT